MKQQRYFKLLTNGGYEDDDNFHLDLEAVYLMKNMTGDNIGYDLVIPNYAFETLHFHHNEVEEVFINYTLKSETNSMANTEEVADLVFSSKTHLDNYDNSLDSKGERWIEEDMDIKNMIDTASKYGKRVFESGSMRDSDDNKPLPFELHPYMLLRYGYHMKTGSLNYGKGNWEKTQPDSDVWDSGGRHFAQALLCFKDPELAKELGLDQEDHLSALLFFVNMIMMNEAKRGIKPNHYFKGKTK